MRRKLYGYIKGIGMTLLTTAAMFGAVSCKPTEKNYRAAYDAALQKREARAAENMLPAEGLLSEDGPQRRILGGDTLYVERRRLSQAEGGNAPSGWYLAVGVYRMSTNAESQAARLKGDGYKDADAFRATSDQWYAVADTAHTLDGAIRKYIDFRKLHTGYPYVGLPGAPVIIESR